MSHDASRATAAAAAVARAVCVGSGMRRACICTHRGGRGGG